VRGYEGALGKTRQQGIHYACPCGALYPARIFASVNARTDAALLAELLAGTLNRLRCPACGARAQADLPVCYHDAEAQLFALVLPQWARAREWEERAALLARLAEDAGALVPGYVRDPFVVYGAAGLRTLIETRGQSGAADRGDDGGDEDVTPVPAAAPEPMPAEAAGPTTLMSTAPIPESSVCSVVEGRVRLLAVRADATPLEQAALDPRILLHRLADYPLVVLAVAVPGLPEASLCVPLDFRAPSGKEVLRALAASFVFEVELHDPSGRRVLAREISAPLEENVRFVTLAAQEALEKIAQPSFAAAARAFAQPGFERLGRKRHNFAEDSFSQLASPAKIKLAAGIVGSWCERENEDELVLVQSFPLGWWRRICSRVVTGALEAGIALPRSLAEHALREGLAPSRRELWSRTLASFAELARGARPSDLDAQGEWENWQRLVREAEAAGLTIDAATSELARAAARRAEELARADLPAQAHAPAAMAELSEDELLVLLERRELRRDAALELCRRPGAVRLVSKLFGIVPRLTRGEAMRVLPALVRLGEPTEPYFVQGLESRKSFVRQGCALGLGALRAAGTAPALVRLLGDEPTDIWREVARALGDVGEAVVEPLVARIRGASGEERERIAFALAHLLARGERTPVEALAEARDSATRQVALRALVLHDAAKAADREVKGPEGLREGTIIRSFTRRFYEALSDKVGNVAGADDGPEEAAEVLSDSDVVEVTEDTARVRRLREASARRVEE
jgi:CpXC protein